MLDILRIRPKKRKVKINKSSGLIFSNPTGKKRILFYLGNLVILVSFIYFIYLYWPLTKALYRYNFHQKAAESNLINETKTLVDTNEFSIKIPKILADAKIVENVSPYNSKEYLKILENDVIAQARGTDLPGGGKGKSTYLFAHSTRQGVNMVRNNSVFYLLGNVVEGESIFLNYHGHIYRYKMYMKKIVNASEINYIQYHDENKELLILQTCWPIGTDWKRLLVFAERI